MSKNPKANEGYEDFDYTVFVIQGILAVSPKHPRWCDVCKTVFPNWKEWDRHPNRVWDYMAGRFWTSSMVFKDEQTACAFMKHLEGCDMSGNACGIHHMHQVRVVKRHGTQKETLVV